MEACQGKRVGPDGYPSPATERGRSSPQNVLTRCRGIIPPGLRRLGYILAAAVTPLSQQCLTDERPREAKYVLAEPTFRQIKHFFPPLSLSGSTCDASISFKRRRHQNEDMDVVTVQRL